MLLSLSGLLLAWGYRLAAGGAAEAARLPSDPTPATAEQVVVAASGVGLAATGLWLTAVCLIGLVDLCAGHRHRGPEGLRRPRLLHSLLRGCAPTMGAVLACSCAQAVAHADEGPPGRPGSVGNGASSTSPIRALAGLPLPDRPTTQRAPGRGTPGRPSGPPQVRRVVQPGDCLWTIAAQTLGPRPGAAATDRAWRALYAVNRDRIGPDPHLIRPGTRLVMPSATALPGPQSLHPPS
jgi:nucleoid-associated protein YgaU